MRTLVNTGCIPDASKIWWDVRPHHKYPTLEFRVCDICTRIDEAIAIAALFQAIVLWLWKLRRSNITFRVYRRDLIEENRWRASRYGLDGKMIDFGKTAEVPTRQLDPGIAGTGRRGGGRTGHTRPISSPSKPC